VNNIKQLTIKITVEYFMNFKYLMSDIAYYNMHRLKLQNVETSFKLTHGYQQ